MVDSVKCNSHETSNLDNQQFRLNKINEIKDYFVAEIKERELMSKGLIEYIASFDYFDKSLIKISATSGSISIALFATVIGTPVGTAGASLVPSFSLSTGLVKKLLKTRRNKKKKYNKIIILARSKLDSEESKISELLLNNRISHEDSTTIINEERNHSELKESIRMMKGQEDKKNRYRLNIKQCYLIV